MRHVLLSLNDTTAPTFTTPPAGSLTSTTTLERTRTLSYGATDQGGGVFRQRLYVDGTEHSNDVVDANGGTCATPFYDPVPCPITAPNASLTLDTATIPDGTHTLRFDVRDATDVNKVESGPWTIQVDNAAPSIGEVGVTGTAREGNALACQAATDGQSPTVSYAWLRTNPDGSGGQAIANATDIAYTLRADDRDHKVICRVTATDQGGTTARDSAVTAGPFADGATVADYCVGRPTQTTDECGDADGDGIVNRLDPDDDNDGVPDASDPVPFSGAVSGPGSNPGASPVQAAGLDLNTVGGLHNPLSEPVGNGVSPADDALLTAKLIVGTGSSARSSSRVLAAFTQGLHVRGRLQTPTGRAIAQARVYLAQKLLGAGPDGWQLGAATQTAPDGSFTLPVARGGRNRDIRVVYFPRGGSDVNRGSNVLALRVRQDATLRPSHRRLHNFGFLTLTGRVLGTIPSSGVTVRVQVWLGRSWYTFQKLSVGRSTGGRFRGFHRFAFTTTATTYRFRVQVVPRNRTAYMAGVSRSVRVRVVP